MQGVNQEEPMLQVTRRGEVRDVQALDAGEDRALRDAFGRRADVANRPAGAAVVQRYQRRAAGCWFLCDCLGLVERRPALIPVAESHIRRHNDAAWPEHHGECDFFREAGEQRTITASFEMPVANRPLGLLDRFRDDAVVMAPEPGRRDYGQGRGALASLLMSLLVAARLNLIEPEWSIGPVSVQYAAIRIAAGTIELEAGVPLSRFLSTYPPGLHELVARIGATQAGRFPGSGRPHGLLVGVFVNAGRGMIHPAHGDPIPVRGEIGIFGEVDGHRERGGVDHGVRAPYLGIALVGRASEAGPVEVLRAYLHPVAAQGHLMPVDSNLERDTLGVIKELERWLRRKRQMSVSVEKPLFDIGGAMPAGPRAAGRGCGDAAHPEIGAAREPCIPDFVVRRIGAPPGAGVAIVETMGYADDVYRSRKHRTHAAMRAALGGASLVIHDFHRPPGVPQHIRDRLFWQACRVAVMA